MGLTLWFQLRVFMYEPLFKVLRVAYAYVFSYIDKLNIIKNKHLFALVTRQDAALCSANQRAMPHELGGKS